MPVLGNRAKFDGKDWTVYDTSNSGLPGDVISAIAVDKVGSVWVGTNSRLAKFDGTSWTVYCDEDACEEWAPSFLEVNEIIVDANGNKWFGTSFSGVFRAGPNI